MSRSFFILLVVLGLYIPSIILGTVIWSDSFETDKGWTFSGDNSTWARGTPTGGSAPHGNPDPSGAHSGSYVIGNNMAGAYNNLENSSATSPIIDCSGYYGVSLSFYRWLNVERVTYDTAIIEVSNDGNSWTKVWCNDREIRDNEWIQVSYDISSVADNQDTVYVRFRLHSDASWRYTGWNIDDLKIEGYNTPNIVYNKHIIGGDGIADVGESDIPLTVELKNIGANATSVSARLWENEANASINSPDSINFGNISTGGTSTGNYSFNVSTSAQEGELLTFYLNIYADGGYATQDSFRIKVGKKLWTILVYINGDNDLCSAGREDVDEMEAIGSDGNINIIVQIDGASTYGGYADTTGSGLNDVRRYYIEAKNSSDEIINSKLLSTHGELDMCAWQTIRDFAVWGIRNYPAKYYWLVLWNHGSGFTKKGLVPFKEYGPDVESGSTTLSISGGELDSALASIQESIGKNLDVFSFDACMMASFGVAYDAKDYANIFVASEELEPGDGWEYNIWLDSLKRNPSLTPEALAREQVEAYVDRYSGEDYITMAAVDINTQIINLAQAVDKFAYFLIQAGGRTNTQIANARTNTEEYISWYVSSIDGCIDLYDFATNIINQSINSDLDSAARAVQSCFGYPVTVPPDSADKFLIYQLDTDLSGVDSSHGIWIWYPRTFPGDTTPFKMLDFAKNSVWDEFICGRTNSDLPNIANITYLMYSAHTDTNYNYTKLISGGDDDGIPDPGEQNSFYIWLRNSGGQAVTSVSATLSVDHPSVTIDSNSSTFPDVPGNLGVVRSNKAYYFTINSDAKIGEWIDFELNLSWSGGSKSCRFPVQIGKVSENATSAYWTVYTEESESTGNIKLISNFSNPISSEVEFQYSIAHPSNVSFRIYNITGQLIRTLVNEKKSKGVWSIKWDIKNKNGTTVPNGIYFYIFEVNNIKKEGKLIIIQ